MKSLEEKIVKEGRVLNDNVLKIDGFLNHQIDVKFIEEIGKEFKRIFKDEKVTKILTVEASGISIAYETSKHFDYVPVIFAKKTPANNQDVSVYTTEVYSYTREKIYFITVAKEYLKKEDNVLIIDDFLANGSALNGMLEVCKQAGCNVVGCGVVVEKAFQSGGKEIREKGHNVVALARIKTMSKDKIEFVD